MSLPSKVTVPRVGWTRRSRILPIVVLPLPDSPISEITSPGRQLEADLAQRRGQPARPGGRPVELGDLVDLQRAHTACSCPARPGRRRGVLLANLPAGDGWPGLISSNGGVWVHLSNANGHRSLNRQPAGGLASDGGRPGMPVSVTWSCRTPTSGSEAISAWVYGCSGLVHDRVGAGPLGQAARVHDRDGVGDLREDRQVVGDRDDRLDVPPVAELEQHLPHRALGGHVQGRGHLVGDQQRRVEQRGHDDRHPLPHAARQLEGVLVEHVLGQADQLESALQLGHHLAPVLDVVRLEQVGDQLADLPGGGQRGHRVLRHQRDLGHPQRPHRPGIRDRQLPAVHGHRAAGRLHPLVQVDEGVAEGRLAAARTPPPGP